MTRTLTIQYGDELLVGLGLSPSEFSTEAVFLLAAKFYELGRLTSGQAAKLCGKERVDFLLDLARIHVPVSNLGADDADEEIAFARHE
jgi:hypothetical protein